MRNQTTRFQLVTTVRVLTGKCPVCGKLTTRRRTFEHTINPFNKNADGTVKDWAQVRRDVNAEANAWRPNFAHQKCEES